ncbi:hypothetical protein FYJ71_02025 [Peptostreptococcus anaerobius]|uniref:Uncharacterized protein n=1 Tax=Peptostreptococcus porci TaxID=2652282 RepID=A0A6N7X0U8_9FIRM|nr:hypothetical protein [Peptostreptococcus porci]MST61751.1 hypothetical protein [Peptostreptococcus porci]
MKYEIKKILTRKYNKIIWAILCIVVIFVGVIPVTTVSTIVDVNSSNLVKGRKAVQLEQERYKNSEGELTVEKISAFIDKIDDFPSDEQAYSNLSISEPAILKVLSYAYSTSDGSFMAEAKKTRGRDFYEKNKDQIKGLISINEDNYKTDEKQIIMDKAQNLKTPYNITYAKQWNLLYKSFGLLYMIMTFIIIVQISSVFSYEKEISMDKILMSSARNRGQIVNNKIKATVLFISIQWLISSFILVAIFGVNFGFSGFFSQIQIEYFTSIYNLTFGEALILEIILGLLTLMSIGLLTIVINYFNENTVKTLLISIVITFVPVIVLRFPNLSYTLRRFIETLPIFGGNIHSNILTLNVYQVLNIPVLRTTKILLNTLIISIAIFLVLQFKAKSLRRKK